MPRSVKPTRPYRSDLRREQAEQTRSRILAAARELFIGRGFAGTTIAAVARDAGTSEETIYATFQNKANLLGTVVRAAVRGEHVETPVLAQAGPVAIAAATDQREQLRMFAGDVVRRLERAAPLLAVLRSAPDDPALAALLGEIHASRATNMRVLVATLEANGPLRVDADRGADTVWALASPEIYNLLTGTRGWTPAEYAEWLAENLVTLLLPPQDAG